MIRETIRAMGKICHFVMATTFIVVILAVVYILGFRDGEESCGAHSHLLDHVVYKNLDTQI